MPNPTATYDSRLNAYGLDEPSKSNEFPSGWEAHVRPRDFLIMLLAAQGAHLDRCGCEVVTDILTDLIEAATQRTSLRYLGAAA